MLNTRVIVSRRAKLFTAVFIENSKPVFDGVAIRSNSAAGEGNSYDGGGGVS